MLSPREWVNAIVTKSLSEPMATEDVLKSLERNIGQSERTIERVQAILNHIDGELVERRGGQVMRDLWHTVADYLEKVQEGQAAA
ncbi:MAG: hypothetical protein K1X51_03930 [Rhodospirillaceae bacterium]|nr:hypothetical protein [Rhodospirillaceae bacterium]